MSADAWDLVVIGTGGAAMAAGQRHRALSSRAFPMVPTTAERVDLPALMAQKSALIDGLRQHKYADVADAHDFTIRYGHARFTDDRTLEVDGEPVVARAYVVATGAAPHLPDVPGLDAVQWLTSTTAMEQQSLPGSLIVMGGGPVGLGQAQLWAHLGTEVTPVGRFPPHADPAVADVLRGVFADDGIEVVEERRRCRAGAGWRSAGAHRQRTGAHRGPSAGRDGPLGGHRRPGAGRRRDRH